MTKQAHFNKNWKYYTGMTCLSLSFILPILGFVVPFLGLPLHYSVPIMTFLTIGGPELLVIFAVALLGKEVYNYYKEKAFRWFKSKRKPKPVSKVRYYIGLAIMIGSALPLYLDAYAPMIMPSDQSARYYVLVAADFVFVLSFFVLGGKFWEKFKKLFIWEG